MIIKNMQKLPEAPDRNRCDTCTKKKRNCPDKRKKSCSLLAVTSRVTAPKSFLLVVEGTMCLSLEDALVNLSTSSSRVFY